MTEPEDIQGSVELLYEQQNLLVAVSTGGPPIASVEEQFQVQQRELNLRLKSLGLMNPFPWKSLWDWYGRWSAGDLPKYQDRRQYISSMAEPVFEALEQRKEQLGLVDWGPGPDPWLSLEQRLEGLKQEVDQASDLDDWQDIGRRAREILIDSANLVYEDSMCPKREDAPKGADVKNRLHFYLLAVVPGSTHEELRSLIRKAVELAHKVAHSSSITRVDAFASAQAAILVVRTLEAIEAARPKG